MLLENYGYSSCFGWVGEEWRGGGVKLAPTSDELKNYLLRLAQKVDTSLPTFKDSIANDLKLFELIWWS